MYFLLYLLQNLVLCFRLHFTKDSQAVINTAGATVRQLVALVFERVIHEDQQQELKDCSINNGYDQQQRGTDSSGTTQTLNEDHQQTIKSQLNYNTNSSNVSTSSTSVIAALGPCAADAYLMFQVFLHFITFIIFISFLKLLKCMLL